MKQKQSKNQAGTSCCDDPVSAADRVPFTKEMRATHTILVPNMLPLHFRMISEIFHYYGYTSEVLEDGSHGDSRAVIDKGLKYVHNDTCYPALLVIGQFLTVLDSGRYDTHRVALLLSQTGGGCRASNYIALLRKALKKAGYGYIPVISFNLTGLEENPGFRLTLPLLRRMAYGVMYADLIMHLRNQCRPYEIQKGDSDRLAEELTRQLAKETTSKKLLGYRQIQNNYRRIIESFARIPLCKRDAVKVGIVGEIYVKFSPLGNNNLEEFLGREGAEVVMGGLADFCIYCVYNHIIDTKLYGFHKHFAWMYRFAYRYLCKKQRDMIRAVEQYSSFAPPSYFDHTKDLVDGYIGLGAKMGEGWLLTAEMLELIEGGIDNIVCAQPFGCLPNHIVGKGKMRPIKEKNQGINLVAVDYDSGASRINQENRLKLMLANAKKTPMRTNQS